MTIGLQYIVDSFNEVLSSSGEDIMTAFQKKIKEKQYLPQEKQYLPQEKQYLPQEKQYLPVYNGGNKLKIIGPISAHQHCITINGTTRHILLFGDQHHSIGSCYMPSDHWISQFKNSFLKFYYTDNQKESIDDKKIRLDKLKKYIETIIKEVEFNKDVMFIYDYILLLAKGNVCVDFFDEMYIDEHLNKSFLSSENPDSGIYYMNILANIFTFCNKSSTKRKYSSLDQEWCSKTFPAIRHHITDIRELIKFYKDDDTDIQDNNFMEYIISFITNIINNEKSHHIIKLNCINNFPNIEEGLDEIYKLLQKQFNKSYLNILNKKFLLTK